MVMLVSLQQASDDLRRDTDDDDADLTLKINIASAAVLDWIDEVDFLDSAGEVEVDSNDQPINVPYPIMGATLLIIRQLYGDGTVQAFLAGDDTDRLGKIPHCRLALTLLEPYRTPRMA